MYYVKVTGHDDATGSYVIHADAVGDTGNRGNAQTIGADDVAIGAIRGYLDTDYFKLTLAETTDLTVRVSGFLKDALATLRDEDDNLLVRNHAGFMLPGEKEPLIRRELDAGVYYISVEARYNRDRTESDQGPYKLRIDTVREPGDTAAAAARLAVGRSEGARIGSPSDVDYFRLDVAEATPVVIRARGQCGRHRRGSAGRGVRSGPGERLRGDLRPLRRALPAGCTGSRSVTR